LTHGPAGNGLCRVFLSLALVKVLQGHKGNGRVQAATVKTETLHGNDVLDLRLLFEVVLDLGDGFNGAVGGRAGGQLNISNHVALVFFGQECSGHAHIQEAEHQHHKQIDKHHPAATAQGLAYKAFIAVGRTHEDTVEPAKKA